MELLTTSEQTHPSTYLIPPSFPQPLTKSENLAEIPVVHLLGAHLHAITEKQCTQIVMDELHAGRAGSIVTMNLDHLRRFHNNRQFKQLCNNSSLQVADGMPLVWASHLQGTPLPERVTGSNLIWSLSEAAAKNQRSVFLVGGDEGTAEESAGILQNKYPNLKIAGTYYPPHGFEKIPFELDKMANAILNANPDIIYVALGSPKQEQLIEKLKDKMPQIWWIGVGISFSFVAGHISRAPKWMQKIGLEWLHRLAQEPKRLSERYLVHGLPFSVKLFSVSFWRRFQLK
jgi:N-acetylglucosaminyldiphosphoundecaprenol N-acetyl-beta-D-mannosaminyltransferase